MGRVVTFDSGHSRRDRDGARARGAGLFYRHVRDLTGFVRLYVPAGDVDDVVSETFLIALRRIADVPANRERSWLFSVAHNVVRNRWRAARRYEVFMYVFLAARPSISVPINSSRLPIEEVDEDVAPRQNCESRWR